MKRVFPVMLLMVVVPVAVLAQGIGPGPSVFSGLGGIGSYRLGSVEIAPFVRVGYENISMNINFPMPSTPSPLFPLSDSFMFDNMDIELEDAYCWVGSFGFEVLISDTIRFFAEATGDAPRGAAVSTRFGGIAADPLIFGGGDRWRWPGTRFERWRIDVGGAWRFWGNAALLAGLKIEHISLDLHDPPQMDYLDFVPPVFGDDSFGDIRAKVWSPYLGVRLNGAGWVCDLVWSPWLTTYDVKVPLRMVLIDSAGGYSENMTQSYYSLAGGGAQLLEASYRQDLMRGYLGGRMRLSLWIEGSWLLCRSSGDEDFQDKFYGTPGVIFTPAAPGSASASSTYHRRVLGGGLSGYVAF